MFLAYSLYNSNSSPRKNISYAEDGIFAFNTLHISLLEMKALAFILTRPKCSSSQLGWGGQL